MQSPSSSRLCRGLSRSWVEVAGAQQKAPRLRVLQLNTLADCLAKSSTLFSLKRGFRCSEDALDWSYRSSLLEQELLRYECDIMGLCEVDHYDDFFQPLLTGKGYTGTFSRKRSPAKDGVAVFWRRSKLAGALRKVVFLEQGVKRSKAAQVAIMQRLCLQANSTPDAGAAGRIRNVVVCSTHLRAQADEDFRLRQAAEVVSAMKEFSRNDAQIILADLNSAAPAAATNPSGGGGSANPSACSSPVLQYFIDSGYRCAYSLVGESRNRQMPDYTTWAGWATGDYRATCDHILVSKELSVLSVLDVPSTDLIKNLCPDGLPNDDYPSDHMSLVADIAFNAE